MTFSPAVYITIGDEYDKKDSIPAKYKGVNFKVSGSRTGQQSLFSQKHTSLAEGDKYIDATTYERRKKLQEEKVKYRPTDAPFRFTNPSHKGPSGSYFGTFSEKTPFKHEVEYSVPQPGDEPAKPKPVPRNFIVSQPKRGGYGYSGLTIGKGDENKYISDPYDGEKRKNALALKESSRKIAGNPFRSGKKGGFFDETTHGVSKVYTLDKPLPAKHLPTISTNHTLTPWVPGGRMRTDLGKYEYQEDPYEAKEKRMREERLAQRSVADPWRPIGGVKSMPTRHIKFTPK